MLGFPQFTNSGGWWRQMKDQILEEFLVGWKYFGFMFLPLKFCLEVIPNPTRVNDSTVPTLSLVPTWRLWISSIQSQFHGIGWKEMSWMKKSTIEYSISKLVCLCRPWAGCAWPNNLSRNFHLWLRIWRSPEVTGIPAANIIQRICKRWVWTSTVFPCSNLSRKSS